MRVPDDPYPDVLAGVIHARLRSDHPAALTAINTIGFTLPARRADKEPSKTVIARIFARDRYQCRYCGERVSRDLGIQRQDPDRCLLTVAAHVDQVGELVTDHLGWCGGPADRKLVDDHLVGWPTGSLHHPLPGRAGLQRAHWIELG